MKLLEPIAFYFGVLLPIIALLCLVAFVGAVFAAYGMPGFAATILALGWLFISGMSTSIANHLAKDRKW